MDGNGGSILGGQQHNGYTTTANISPKSLVLTVTDARILVGQSVPAFSYVLSGLTGGDDPGVVSGVQYSSTVGSVPRPGRYEVSASNGIAENYQLTYVDGVLQVIGLAIGTRDSSAYTGYEDRRDLVQDLAAIASGHDDGEFDVEECGVKLKSGLGKSKNCEM